MVGTFGLEVADVARKGRHFRPEGLGNRGRGVL